MLESRVTRSRRRTPHEVEVVEEVDLVVAVEVGGRVFGVEGGDEVEVVEEVDLVVAVEVGLAAARTARTAALCDVAEPHARETTQSNAPASDVRTPLMVSSGPVEPFTTPPPGETRRRARR